MCFYNFHFLMYIQAMKDKIMCFQLMASNKIDPFNAVI